MARCRAVTQEQIKRDLLAAKEAGLVISGYEVDHRAGKVLVYTNSGAVVPGQEAELDRELAEFEMRHGNH
jgi:hypothetical protein